LRDDGIFVWTSPQGRQWTAVELFQETMKQNLSPGDEAAVLRVAEKLRRLQQQRPKVYSFV
jgi:uncharacterized protein YoaH (UPF0181 family)